MAVLKNVKHEQFVGLVLNGKTGTEAYASVWGSAKGAAQSASRLLRNAEISARIAELRGEIAKNLLADTILERKSRLQLLENRHKKLMQVIEERGQVLGQLNLDGYPLHEPLPQGEDHETSSMSSTPAPGASTGLVCLDWRGKSADRAVWKVDTGTLSELRAIEEQAARELGEWNPDAATPGGGLTVPVQVNVTFVAAAANG